MSVPIPQRKPPVPGEQGDGFFQGVKDTVNGVFTAGLEFFSEQMEFERRMDMIRLQQKMENQAAQANRTASPGGAGSMPGMLAGFSPLTVAILAIAGLLVWKG